MSNNDIQSVYGETQERLEQAYKAFKAAYEVMKPPPQMAEVNRSFFGFKQVGMLLALVGSVIVSASHTVPVFLGISSITEINIASAEFVIAIAVFVMIEMAVVTFAYSATESEANVEAAHHVKRLTRWGMWFIVTIMILGNVYYVLSSNIAIPSEGLLAGMWSFTRLTIFLLIGTSAPVVAFMTGDILAIDVIKHRAKSKRAEQEHATAYSEWAEGLQNSWNSQKRRWGGSVDIQVTKPEIKQLETVSNSSKQLDSGQSLTQKAAMQYIMEKAEEYKTIAKTVREQNPTANQRDIAEAIAKAMTGDGRGYMTVIRAYKKLNIEME